MATSPAEPITEYSAPLSVFLNLTQQCNMGCVYCSAEAVRREPAGELSDEEMMDLLEELIEARVFHYLLTGGEPFLRRELLFRMLERLTGCGQVSLLTNGSLITDEDARRLAGFPHLSSVALSIDAPDEEDNARTRGRGFLARTLRGARRLMDQGITPSVNCVLTRWNQQRIPALVAFLKEQGFRRLFVVPMHPVGNAREQDLLAVGCRDRLAVSREIVELAAREKELKIVLEDEPWLGLDKPPCRPDLGDRPPAPLLPCSAGVEQCTITADGWVTPCNAMSGYRCGNVRERGFLPIWRESPRLEAMRALRRTPVTAIPECAACEHNRRCRGGCRAIAFAVSGDVLGLDPTCPYHGTDHRQPTERLPVVA